MTRLRDMPNFRESENRGPDLFSVCRDRRCRQFKAVCECLRLERVLGGKKNKLGAGVFRNENRSVGPVRRRAAGGSRAFDCCVHIAAVKERQAPVEEGRGGRGAGWARPPAEGGILGTLGGQRGRIC